MSKKNLLGIYFALAMFWSSNYAVWTNDAFIFYNLILINYYCLFFSLNVIINDYLTFLYMFPTAPDV